MPILSCYVDERTFTLLKSLSNCDSTGRSPITLAEAAISEVALSAAREQGLLSTELRDPAPHR